MDSAWLYLRARYYNPGMGVFPSLDPFEGMHGRPMSLNGYSWVEGNTPNLTDPSGFTPDSGGIIAGRYRFSCKCGWLDAEHMDFGVPEAVDRLVSVPIQWSNFAQTGQSRQRSVYLGFIQSAFAGLGNDNAIVNENHPKYQTHQSEIAVGIWMEAQEKLESRQIFTSSYAVEDLVSNIVGYAMWRAIEQGVVDRNDLAGRNKYMEFNAKWDLPWLRSECDVADVDYSLAMLGWYQAFDGLGKSREWTPRAMPFDSSPLSAISNDAQRRGSTFRGCERTDIDNLFMGTESYNLQSTHEPSSSPNQGVWWWATSARSSANRIQVRPNDPWPVFRDNLYIATPDNLVGGC